VRTARATAPQLRTGEQAVWGARPAGQSPRRLPRLKDCAPHRSGAMLAFLSVELASGMIVNGFSLMTDKNRPWWRCRRRSNSTATASPGSTLTASPFSIRSPNFATVQPATALARSSLRPCSRDSPPHVKGANVIGLPALTDRDTPDDRGWFAANPMPRSRIRETAGVWRVIRRRGQDAARHPAPLAGPPILTTAAQSKSSGGPWHGRN
jgi:hypothetical protein